MEDFQDKQHRDFYDSLTLMGKVNIIAGATTVSAYIAINHGEDFVRIYTAVTKPMISVATNAADVIQLMYRLAEYYNF
ncbi:hypothetical protein HYU10_01135 [Candidatus Woesearchaeota archaeon]|nr:hypothetical protein [Candidatus Woesearchaeota archaeon]MBI2130351.1 hypothetical protein [Candidatus Woesearchaeota archaeon]